MARKKPQPLTAAQVKAIEQHVARHIDGQRKALAKWLAARKHSDLPQIEGNIRYCRQAIGLLENVIQTAQQRQERKDGRTNHSGQLRKRA